MEIVSITPDGDLHIDGDIDLSGYRYASVNPHTQQTGVRGSGEAGALVMRAGGDFKIFGSVSDGFDGAALPVTPDDNGWMLVKGRAALGRRRGGADRRQGHAGRWHLLPARPRAQLRPADPRP